MAYQKQTWRDYDDTKTELQNVNNGAVVTPERLNHIENGIANSADKAEVTAQLADKVTKGQASVYDIDKNKGLLDETYLTDGLKQQIAGTAPVNATPPTRSITTIKTAKRAIDASRTTFVEESTNLYNSKVVLLNQNLNLTNGTTFANTDFYVSEFIEVDPSTTLKQNHPNNVVFYDAEKVFISSLTGPTDISVPSNAYYLRIALIGATRRDTTMLVLGSVLPSVYTPYEIVMKKTNTNGLAIEATALNTTTYIPDDIVQPRHVSHLNQSGNLFDNKKAKIGFYVNSTNGNEAASANYFVSDFMEVKPETAYVSNITSYYVFYDAQKKYISGNTSGTSFTSPANAKYLRKSGFYPSSQYNVGMVVEGTVLPTTYVPYEYQLENEVNVEPKQWKGKNLLTVGDSYTAADVYQRFANEICGFSNITIDAVVGRTLSNFHQNITAESLVNIDVVTVLGGANDFNNLVLGSITDTKDSNTWYGINKKLIEHILTLKPTVRLVFVTVSQFYTTLYPSGVNASGVTPFVMSKATKEVCASYGVPVIDVFGTSGFNQFTENVYLSTDRLHPNATGYERIGRLIGKGLNAIY